MTREEDLVRIAKKLDKMVSRNNTEGALDLLKELKNFNMTLKLLQETRIGMSVNGVRKHCTDEDVVSLAKILIKNWKRLLAERPNELKNESEASKPTESPREPSPDREASPKSCLDSHKKLTDKHRKEKKEVEQRKEKQESDHRKEKHVSNHAKERGRIEALDSTVFSPSLPSHPSLLKCPAEMKKERREAPVDFFPAPPPLHPPAHPRRPSTEVKKERREASGLHSPYPLHLYLPIPLHIRIPKRQPEVKKNRRDSAETLAAPLSQNSSAPRSSPPRKRPSLEVPKERKKDPDPNSPIPPLPLHLHPSPQKPSALDIKKERKEPVDPDAFLPRLPLPLHPPTPTKRPSLDIKKDKEKERKDTSAAPKQTVQQRTSDPRKDRDGEDSKPPKRPPAEAKRERKDSPDLRQPAPKKLSQDGKKERKDSTESKSGQRRQSSDIKPQRRDSANSKSGSSPPPAKKLLCERRDSHGSKFSHPGTQQRKLSTDSNDGGKSKPETPKTPSTPGSPLSPSFSCGGGPLSPHLLTGDSIRDKCIEMLSAALRSDDDYKDYGANCDAMASEIEDHIYQEIKATDMKYKNRVRSRISNLKDPKNPNLRKNVLGGAIELSRIATMTAEEMASDELKQLRSVLTQEAIREHQMAKTGGTTTDLLQCSKCKKKNCTYNQVQTRSADEPMTTFVLCNECGNRWKFC